MSIIMSIIMLSCSIIASMFFAALCLINIHRAIRYEKQTLYADPIAIILFVLMLAFGIASIILI